MSTSGLYVHSGDELPPLKRLVALEVLLPSIYRSVDLRRLMAEGKVVRLGAYDESKGFGMRYRPVPSREDDHF